MADSVNSTVIFNGNKRYIANFTSISDGTGESAVKKIDISTLTNVLGAAPTKVKLYKVKWAVFGMSVALLFDHTTDDRVMTLSWQGERCFYDSGPISDPASTGGTGDLLFTTIGHAANDTYDITVEIMLSNK